MSDKHMVIIETRGPPPTVLYKGPFDTYALAQAYAIVQRDAICAADPANRRGENTTDGFKYVAVEKHTTPSDRSGIVTNTIMEKTCASYRIVPTEDA